MAFFFRRGVSVVYFLPAVANKAAPTRAEINAGTNLTTGLADVTGFNFQNNPIPTPDMASAFTTSIVGEDTVDSPTLTFYDDNASTTKRTALAKNTAGFLLLMPYGDGVGKRAETYPVTSTGVNDQWTAGNDAAQFQAQFAVTAVPSQAAVLPA